MIAQEADNYLIRHGSDQGTTIHNDYYQSSALKGPERGGQDLVLMSFRDNDEEVQRINDGREQFKDAYTKYKSNKRVHHMQVKQELRQQEQLQMKEASQLVKRIKQEKQQRFEIKKQRIQSILDKQIEALNQVSSRIEGIKFNSIDPTGFLDGKLNDRSQLQQQQYKVSQMPKSVKQNHAKSNNLLNQYQVRKLRWKPKKPLYQELEDQFKQQLEISEIQSRQKLFQIKSQFRPIERSEIIQHQKAYDELLKNRANKASQNVFGKMKFKRNSSLENSTGRNEDLDIVLNEEGITSSNKKKKKRNYYQQLALLEDKKKLSPFEKEKQEKKLKDYRKNMYDQYVRELNLPLELDRETLKKEAQKLRIQEEKMKRDNSHSALRAKLIKEMGSPEMQETFGRNITSMSRRRDYQQSLPPILSYEKTSSQVISPRNYLSQTPNPYQTPSKTKKPIWAEKILKNNDQPASQKDKVDFIMSKAKELEEQAERLDEKIEIKNSRIKETQNFNKRAVELYIQQQEAGDKLVDAIKAKLALLDDI